MGNILKNKSNLMYLALGGLIGIGIYHLMGTTVDKIWNRVPVLNTVHSNYAQTVANLGSEI